MYFLKNPSKFEHNTIFMFCQLPTEFQQPDEDDYGYASKDAMDIYNKIMNKYVNTPAESRNATISHHRSSDIIGAKVCEDGIK